MLTNLQIKNFLLIDELELDFYNGLTVITGETGSGKSITIDALMIIFGNRAERELIRQGQIQASFTASFQIDNRKILDWLKQKEFFADNNDNVIICRRVIDINGRSKGYINSFPVNLATLKELGEMLLDIHTQHASIALLKNDNQRMLLDEFAGVTNLVTALTEKYRIINLLEQKLNVAQSHSQELILRQEILNEKIHDLINLDLKDHEWEELQIRQKQLANAGFLLQELDFAINMLNNEQNSVNDMVATLQIRLDKISDFISNYSQITKLLDSLSTEVSELERELQLMANKVEQDPSALEILDNRIDEIYSLARKYRILPEEIPAKLNIWQDDLNKLSADTDLDGLTHELNIQKTDYLNLAQQISSSRHKAADKLSQQVTKLLKQLSINGEFRASIDSKGSWNSFGLDNIQYQVCFNEGMTMQPLNKVASGGELSRVALALYVTLSVNNPPELIVFDEIDVGIGGRVAEVVGRLLKKLGKSKQVICITHQPQTACCGENHLSVSKITQNKISLAKIDYIGQDKRVNEIARMLGGMQITDTTIQHARELLKLD